MQNLAAHYTLAAVHFSAMVSPGPTAFLVIRNSSLRNRAVCAATVSGVIVATIVNVFLVLVGVAWILTQIPTTQTVIRFFGAGYLAWVSFKMFKAAFLARDRAAVAQGRLTRKEAFIEGFFVNAFNINILIFYLSALAPLCGNDTSGLDKLLYGLQIMLQSLVYWSLIAILASGGHVVNIMTSNQREIDLFISFVLLFFATKMLTELLGTWI